MEGGKQTSTSVIIDCTVYRVCMPLTVLEVKINNSSKCHERKVDLHSQITRHLEVSHLVI